MGNFGEFPPKAEDGDRGSEGGLLRRGLRPTVAREHVRGPDVISTATVKGAREISAGRSPLAKQVARAVRARRNHVGGVPANCGSGELVGAGLDTNRIARKRFNGLESHPYERHPARNS